MLSQELEAMVMEVKASQLQPEGTLRRAHAFPGVNLLKYVAVWKVGYDIWGYT